MRRAHAQIIAATLLVLVSAAACKSVPVTGGGTQGAAARPRIYQPAAAQRALGIYQPWSDGDVEFMSGMIPHHAQAVVMGGWAPTRAARKDLQILIERMVVSQGDEIAMMQQWLRDRGLPVPDAKATRHKMKMMMNGVETEHEMLMPGMLTDDEMAALEKARGPEFDRLFLIGMIKHHQGAIDMVDKLFKSYGAAQSDDIYKFASDVHADQEIEIEVMKNMLAGGGM